MERKSIIPRRKVNVPETLVIFPSNPSNVVASGPASTPLPPPNEQATHPRPKAFSLQLSRGGEPSHEAGVGRNRFLSSSKYWTGKGGLQSPRLHGFSPRDVNAFEQRKFTVECIAEEGDMEGEKENEARGESEELVFDMGENDLGGAKSSTEDWRVSDGAAPGSSGRRLPPPDWPLPLLPGVGILPDRLHTSSVMASPGSDTNQIYRSLNQSSISSLRMTALQNTHESNILLQQPPVTTVNKELPVYLRPRVSPLLPPLNLEERSRLASITPSLVAELELEELEARSFGGEDTKGLGVPKAKSRKASGRRAADIPILSSFSTDSADFTEDELEGEKRQANCLPLQTVPGQLLNLVEIDSGDPAMGRKRSIRRKPVVGKSKLAQEWEKRSSYQSNSGSDNSSYHMQAQDRPQLLDTKRANHRRQAHPPFDQKGPGIYPKPLSGGAFYEGYALESKSGVYIPLNMTTPPLAIDQSLLYMVVPKKEISDRAGRAYHIIRPNGADKGTTSPGLGLYAYEEASRGFVLTQTMGLILEGRKGDQDSISSMKEFQWPIPDEAGKVETNVKQQQSPPLLPDSRKNVSGDTPTSRARSCDERSYDDSLVDPKKLHPTIHRKQAKLLGLGRETREIGNIEYVKGLQRGNSVKIETGDRSSRAMTSEEWDYGGNQKGITNDSTGNKPGGEGFVENEIYVARKFEIDVMDAPIEVPAKERDSDTDVETGKRRRDMSLNGQSWLEIAGNPMTNLAANNICDWGEGVGLKEEEAVSPVEGIQTLENTKAFNITPRLPMYKPPKEMNNTQMHFPILPTLSIPVPSSGPKDLTNISQSRTTASPPLLPQPPRQESHRPRKLYATLTLNLYRSRNEQPRTTRILIPVLPAVRELDDQKIFLKVRKEYIATTGGLWRAWCGLRGIKWVGINERSKPVRRLRPHSASNSHSQRPGSSASNTSSYIPLDPALTRSARLIRYINKPQTARGQCGYMELLRGSVSGTRPATYSMEIVEDWIPWKVGVVGVAPVVASVAATAAWYYTGYGGGTVAFQIGILIAILGWGIVGVLVLLS